MNPESPGGPWTSHGHDVAGVTVVGSGRPARARCGGPKICTKCALEAAQLQQQGHCSGPGVTVVENRSGKPERILTGDEWEHMTGERRGER